MPEGPGGDACPEEMRGEQGCRNRPGPGHAEEIKEKQSRYAGENSPDAEPGAPYDLQGRRNAKPRYNPHLQREPTKSLGIGSRNRQEDENKAMP